MSETPPARPDERLPFSARLLLVSFVFLVAVIGAAIWGETQANRYATAAFETQQRELETIRMLSLLQDTEVGQRGYILTGNESFLEPYNRALAEIDQLRARFKSISLGDAIASRSAERLDSLIDERLGLLVSTLAITQQGQRDEAIAIIRQGVGKTRMDEIRTIVTEINNARDKVLADQQENLRRVQFWVRIVEVFGVFVLIMTAFTIVRQSVLTLQGQRKLRESQQKVMEAATAATQAKSAFLATMSHELRTPMTAILGMCDLLLAGKQSREERQITRLLARNAETLLKLLNDILDLSKVEAGRMTFEKQDFRLSGILGDVQSLFGPVASQKGLLLRIEPNSGPQDVFSGDAKRLQQVLVNLVGNAIKFTSHGSVSVRATQAPAAAGKVAVRFEVEDTGEGIADDAKERLFREFEQEDTSTSRRFGGTGLGLSISKRIVEALGGTIGVESVKGKGSCFSFVLALDEGDAAAVTVRTPVSAADAGSRFAGRRLRILLAEDTPATQFLVARMLSLWGHEVTTASNGQEAVNAAATCACDVILMDMQMPVMDGMQATRAIRAGDGLSARTPIVALTADAVVTNRKAYLAAGCDVVVTKPIDWADLAHQIMMLVSPGDSVPSTALPPIAAPPEDVEEKPILDHALIDELAATLGPDTVRPLIANTLGSLTTYVATLKQHVADEDLKQAKRVAHQIKGAGAQVGASRVAEAARMIEVESNAMADIPPKVLELEASLRAFEAAYADYFKNREAR